MSEDVHETTPAAKSISEITGTQQHEHGTILVVDDQEATRDVIARLLSVEGYDVLTASNAIEALAAVGCHAPDVVLLDVLMPGMNGFELCKRLKANDQTRLTPVVLVTGLQSLGDRIHGIRSGADDFICKPIDRSELLARVRSFVRLKRYADDMESAESVIIGLALTVEARDGYTLRHCERLADYAVRMGRHLGLQAEDLRTLRRGAYIHDIGKIAVPDSILLKPGALTSEEFEVMKRHTLVGDELCSGFRSLQPVRRIVRYHHERRDGSGYPDGLRGDEIPLLAQIVAIADIYDGLTTRRPYKPAFSQTQAFERLALEVAWGWRRRDLVQALEKILGESANETRVP